MDRGRADERRDGAPRGAVDREAQARLVFRAALPAFLRSTYRMAHLAGDDRITSSLVLSIIDANVRHMLRDPDLALRYAQSDTPPPDELRRPVSVRALADSLRISYEAARGRVVALEAHGVCKRTPQGVYVPAAVLGGRLNRQALEINFDEMRNLAQELRRWAPDFDLMGGPAPMTQRVSSTRFERLAARFFAEYMLRSIERLGALTGHLPRGLMLLQILHHNESALRDDPDIHARYGRLGAPPPPEVLVPISILALSGMLKQPFETTRRNVNHLIRQGFCVRSRAGVIISRDLMDSPAVRQHLLTHMSDLQRVYSSMAGLGVVFD